MVSLDTLFELFGDERRRYALYYLHERGEPVAVDELVDVISEWEDGRSEREGPWSDLQDLRIDLEHHHLPKTADVDFVQYHPERGTIRVQGPPPEFDALVTVARVIERPAED